MRQPGSKILYMSPLCSTEWNAMQMALHYHSLMVRETVKGDPGSEVLHIASGSGTRWGGDQTHGSTRYAGPRPGIHNTACRGGLHFTGVCEMLPSDKACSCLKKKKKKGVYLTFVRQKWVNLQYSWTELQNMTNEAVHVCFFIFFYFFSGFVLLPGSFTISRS